MVPIIPVFCRTNLDVLNEQWPTRLPCRPVVGDYITSKTKHPQYKRDENGFSLGGFPTHYFQLELEVVAVCFKPAADGSHYMEVELGIKRLLKWSVKDFFEWYAPMVGKSVSYFI